MNTAITKTPTRNQVKAFMIRELKDLNHPDLWDVKCGEVNCTRLAENAAHQFDHDEWLDDETHWVWDLACDVADRAEKEFLRGR